MKREGFVRANLGKLLIKIARYRHYGKDARGRNAYALNATDFSVLLCVANHLAFNTPFSYVTQAEIARETRGGKSGVSESVKKLIGYGMIKRRKKKDSKGKIKEDKSCFVVDPSLFWRGDKAALYVAKNTTWANLIKKEIEKNGDYDRLQRHSGGSSGECVVCGDGEGGSST